jgi:thymidine kinase
MGNNVSTLKDGSNNTIGLGYMEVIIGPMFSGKTSRLIEIYKEHMDEYIVTVINHKSDDRYTKESSDKMYTHDGLNIPCVYTETLSELPNNKPTTTSKVLLINEGNFFPDLIPYVLKQVEQENNIVYVAGLDGDFQRHKFGTILDLIPYADKVTKLSAKCNSCTRKALFSYRVDQTNKEQQLVGTDEYQPLCRQCYLNLIVDESEYSQIIDTNMDTIDTVIIDSSKTITKTIKQEDISDMRELQRESMKWDPFGPIYPEQGI